MDNSDLIGVTSLRDTKLYRVLYKGLPNHRSKHNPRTLDCYRVAADIGISHQAVYKWFERGEIPTKRLKKLCALKGSTLSPEKLIPFIPG